MVFQSGTRSERNFVRQRNDAEEYSWEERYLAGLEEAEARSGTAFGRSAKRFDQPLSLPARIPSSRVSDAVD